MQIATSIIIAISVFINFYLLNKYHNLLDENKAVTANKKAWVQHCTQLVNLIIKITNINIELEKKFKDSKCNGSH